MDAFFYRNTQGNRGQCLQVIGDILTNNAITSGSTQCEQSFLISEDHCESIQFWFKQIVGLRHSGIKAGDALVPIDGCLGTKAICQA